MEYMKVIVPNRNCEDIDVLLNSARNGKIGQVITLNKGFVLVTVDLPGAEKRIVDVQNTTPANPKCVEIRA